MVSFNKPVNHKLRSQAMFSLMYIIQRTPLNVYYDDDVISDTGSSLDSRIE